jgi:PAS domain S-box-containing protein
MSAEAAIEDMTRRLSDMEATLRDQTNLEAVLRISEVRAGFMLELSDALRTLADPVAIQREAMHRVGKHLGVDRVLYAEVHADGDTMTIGDNYVNGVAPVSGRMKLSAFGPQLHALYREGKTATSTDIDFDPMSADQRAAFTTLGIRAYVGTPLFSHGRLAMIFAIHSKLPRVWTTMEIALIQEVADRTWSACECARAQVALRESEARFRQFADASSGALWVRNSSTMAMEYGSSAIAAIYGVEANALLGDVKHWASLVVPEDRAKALQQLVLAAHGEPVTQEFRIQRANDFETRWIRDTSFRLQDDAGNVHRIGGIAQDITDTKLAIEHRDVLLAELQDRVRNIMAIMRSIIARTEERARSVREYSGLMSGRLLALARVQALITRAGTVSADLETVVRDELIVLAGDQPQFLLSGPKVALGSKAAEVLALAIHELATNALKHGALSLPQGKVTVQWDVARRGDRNWIIFNWMEDSGPVLADEAPVSRGFGRELIEERIPNELGGLGQITFQRSGARCRLEFPTETLPRV